ncbi:MAG: alpha/beta hydrolase [Bacteroidales bacterium]|nr:alpha/beta hydrolase [Bacteroidales bacterium]
MKNLLLSCLTVLLLTCSIVAQVEIRLYPYGPAEESGITAKETQYGTSWVVDVTEARMFAYIVPKEKANGTAVLICPGGGYGGLAMEHEGTMVAQWLNSIGISAFVLYYRMPNHHPEIPLKDAQTAIELIRKNSKKWNIDRHKVGIAGFSAGGHLASTVGTQNKRKNRPDFMILVYPVITMTRGDGTCENLLGKDPSDPLINRFSTDLHVTEKTPPTFLVAAVDDDVVSIEHSYKFYKALQARKVPSEIHAYKSGGHSFGMKKKGLEVDNWPDLLIEWFRNNKWVRK